MFERRPSREEQAIQDLRVFLIEYLDQALGSIYEKIKAVEEEVKRDVKPNKSSDEASE